MGIYIKTAEGLYPAATVAGPEGPEGPTGPPGSVDSVNGDPGPDVVLDAADVGAHPAGGAVTDAMLPGRLRELGQESTDLNTETTFGIKYASNTTPNTPIAWWGTVLVEPSIDGSWVKQTYTRWNSEVDLGTGDTGTWIRFKPTTGTWGAWLRVRQSETELDTRYKNVGEEVTTAELPARLRDHLSPYPVTGDATSATISGTFWWSNMGDQLGGLASGILYVGAYSDDYVTQVAVQFDTNNVFTRAKNNGGWSAWQRLRRTDEDITDAELPPRLGVDGQVVTDWNDATVNGWYRSLNNSTNGPTNDYLTGRVDSRWDNGQHFTQTVWEFNSDAPENTKSWRRQYDNGVWGAWHRTYHTGAELDARYIKGTVVGGANLLYDSGFENSENVNWSSEQRSTAVKRSGSQSMTMTRSGGGLITVSGINGNVRSFKAGDKVTLSAWFYLTNGVTPKINLYSFSPLADLPAVGVDPTLLNQWQRVVATWTVQTDSDAYYPRIYADGGIDGTWQVDDFQLEYGDVATAYAPAHLAAGQLNTTASTTVLRRNQTATSTYQQSLLLENNDGHPALGFHRPGITAGGLRLNSDGAFELVDDPGTAYRSLRVGTVTAPAFKGMVRERMKTDLGALTGTVNLDLNVASVFEGSQSGNITLTMSNVPIGASGTDSATTTTVILYGNGNGYTITPPAGTKMLGAAMPTSTSGKYIVLTFQNNGHTSWTMCSAAKEV